ncbi:MULTISPECIES: lipopolysaccharide biosynthesis protein [Actinomyces]|uniref:Lipopolysaccharide biosynthesis protein n=1 Tax=Actinomyces respiraculi TaxID=2744574 RepID=A0A7T0LLW4_9ACTO|nr:MULTISPECIES: lipopolysaccharide biosynthesis protein [Actinomyces]QPL05831.1 lipopolysaccharide biosynthesis protein [Actinomyces respiraculi]
MASSEGSQLRRDYVWNAAASLAASVFVVLTTAVVSHVIDIQAVGIYALAIANGQLFQTLGMYEVRTYHVTDVRRRFSFGTYLAARIVTVVLMIAAIVVHALVTGNSASAAILMILIASVRVFDAFEDVFYSEFQRAGRLDLGGRACFVRTMATMIVFCLMVVLTGHLLVSTVTTLVASLVVMVLAYVPPARSLYSLRPSWDARAVLQLLAECLPLFLASFLNMFIFTAPRWAIDTSMGEAAEVAQGYFTVIFMPASAINLLSLLVFRPLLTPMATRWAAGDDEGFLTAIRRGLVTTFLASLVVAAAAYVAGPPVLDLVYSTDVSGLRLELMVLIAGGALNAGGVILYYALSTMRLQRLVLVGYVVGAVAAGVLCRILVPPLGLLGAATAFTGSMAVLALCFAAGIVVSHATARDRDPRATTSHEH